MLHESQLRIRWNDEKSQFLWMKIKVNRARGTIFCFIESFFLNCGGKEQDGAKDPPVMYTYINPQICVK